MLNAKIKDKNYFLINLYGPNKDAEAVRFYQDLSTTLRGIDLDSDSNVIVGGDFNRPFYSCRLGDLALEWQRGWSWPCFDTDLTAFIVQITLFLC